MQLKHGTLLHGGRYRIENVLGQGAFGITYLAIDITTNRSVAVKEFFMKEINGREGTYVTAPSNREGSLFYDYKKKFIKEAKLLSKLNHPHIVNVIENFEDNNTSYYSMVYLPGGDLDFFINRCGSLTELESLKYAIQICQAIKYMHSNKMLHLDLKPKNIMLDTNGDAVLIDFGLSKQYNKNGEPESSTTVGRGTPGYSPVEQSNYQDGHGFPVTMDVYAFGATLFKMITGMRAPEASVILNEGFPFNKLQDKGASAEFCSIVVKSMAPLKKDRFQTINEVLMELVSISSNDETCVDCTNDINKDRHCSNIFIATVSNNDLWGGILLSLFSIVLIFGCIYFAFGDFIHMILDTIKRFLEL